MYCKKFFCSKKKEYLCCRYCSGVLYLTCKERCLNDPKKCGLFVDNKPKTGYCNILFCDIGKDNTCCIYCNEYDKCYFRCNNSPLICGQSTNIKKTSRYAIGLVGKTKKTTRKKKE